MSKPYNRLAALRYAKEWAFSRNPDYYDFNDIGGDCTNYASQVCYAGSGIMNYSPLGWYYISSYSRSPSWTGVEPFFDFMTTNEGRGPYGIEVSRRQIVPADFVQLSFDGVSFSHTLVILQVYPEITVAAHTNDAFDRPLSSYTYENIRFIHILGVRE